MKYFPMIKEFSERTHLHLSDAAVSYKFIFLSVISGLWFLSAGCDKEAREYDASLKFKPDVYSDYSTIIIREDLPLRLDYMDQKGNVFNSTFFYNFINKRLDKIASNGLEYRFTYNNDTIKLNTNNSAQDSLIAVLKNDKIQLMLNQNTVYRYDSNGYLIERVNNFDSTHFKYSNGNLTNKVHWISFMNMTFFTDYTYYDSLFINRNASFFLKDNYLPQNGGTSDRELRYLDIFGRLSKNLPKRIRVSRGNIPDTAVYNYKWYIQNERIEKMEIRLDTTLFESFKYTY